MKVRGVYARKIREVQILGVSEVPRAYELLKRHCQWLMILWGNDESYVLQEKLIG